MVARVHNTGGRALDMNGSLKLLGGPGGLTAGPFPATLGISLAIGDTEPVTIALDKALPAGPWDARITLHSGLVVRSAHATLTFPKAGTAAAVTATATGGRPGWLYPALAGLGALLLLGLVGFQIRRLRRPDATPPRVFAPTPPPVSPPGDRTNGDRTIGVASSHRSAGSHRAAGRNRAGGGVRTAATQPVSRRFTRQPRAPRPLERPPRQRRSGVRPHMPIPIARRLICQTQRWPRPTRSTPISC